MSIGRIPALIPTIVAWRPAVRTRIAYRLKGRPRLLQGEQILECTNAGITLLVQKTLTANRRAEGHFDKQDFLYVAAHGEYRCPARGAGDLALYYRWERLEDPEVWRSVCPRCPIRAQRTTSDYRRITRWEHETVLEAMQDRLDRQPEIMRVRRQTAEHPFGTHSRVDVGQPFPHSNAPT